MTRRIHPLWRPSISSSSSTIITNTRWIDSRDAKICLVQLISNVRFAIQIQLEPPLIQQVFQVRKVARFDAAHFFCRDCAVICSDVFLFVSGCLLSHSTPAFFQGQKRNKDTQVKANDQATQRTKGLFAAETKLDLRTNLFMLPQPVHTCHARTHPAKSFMWTLQPDVRDCDAPK